MKECWRIRIGTLSSLLLSAVCTHTSTTRASSVRGVLPCTPGSGCGERGCAGPGSEGHSEGWHSYTLKFSKTRHLNRATASSYQRGSSRAALTRKSKHAPQAKVPKNGQIKATCLGISEGQIKLGVAAKEQTPTEPFESTQVLKASPGTLRTLSA